MQPILITSPQESNQKLCNLLQNKGLRTLPVPLIETVPVAFKPIDIGRYTWLVFTSKNGVAHFLGQLNKAYKELARQKQVAAIGTGTAKMLAEEGFKVAMQEDALTSRHFGNSLVPRFNQDDRALLIQGEMAGNMLQETLQQKCSTDKIVVYRTNELQLTRSDKDKLTSNAYLWALYTSPTGFKAYQKHVTNINQRKIACIGQTTAAYISRQGYKPQFIASNPNFETVAKELSNCMQFMVQHSTFTT